MTAMTSSNSIAVSKILNVTMIGIGVTRSPNFNLVYPLTNVGVGIGIIGLISVIVGYRKLQRVTRSPLPALMLGSVGLILILAGYSLMGYVVRGSGWVIVLYGEQGLYLFVLGIGMVIYVVLHVFVRSISAVLLSVGFILAGYPILEFLVIPSDFDQRCNVQTGCSAVLAHNTIIGFIMLGLLLAFATFLIGFGLAYSRVPKSNKKSPKPEKTDVP